MIRDENDLHYTLSLIKKYDVINACYQKAQHYINLASKSLTYLMIVRKKEFLKI